MPLGDFIFTGRGTNYTIQVFAKPISLTAGSDNNDPLTFKYDSNYFWSSGSASEFEVSVLR